MLDCGRFAVQEASEIRLLPSKFTSAFQALSNQMGVSESSDTPKSCQSREVHSLEQHP